MHCIPEMHAVGIVGNVGAVILNPVGPLFPKVAKQAPYTAPPHIWSDTPPASMFTNTVAQQSWHLTHRAYHTVIGAFLYNEHALQQ